MSDEDLIEQYYACNDNAFAELHARYFPCLVVFLRRRYGLSQEDAEDLAVETFYRVVRTKRTGRSRYDSSRPNAASFKTFLFRIAINLTRTHLAKLGRIPPTTSLEPEEGLPANEDSSEELALLESINWEHFSEPVADCIARLSEAHRAVLLLFLLGFSTREIAAIEEIPHGRVATRKHHALKNMRVCLQRQSKAIRTARYTGSERPPGIHVLARMGNDELLVLLDMERLKAEGYRIWPARELLPAGARKVLEFTDAEEVLIVGNAHREEKP